MPSGTHQRRGVGERAHQGRQAEHDGTDREPEGGKGERVQPGRPRAEDEVGGGADHRPEPEQDAEPVQPRAGEVEDAQQAEHAGGRSGHDEARRRPAGAEPGQEHQQHRRHVLDQQRDADAHPRDRGEVHQLRGGDGEGPEAEDDPPLRQHHREPSPHHPQPQRQQQDGRAGDPPQHGRAGRPARVEQRTDEGARHREGERGRQPEHDAEPRPGAVDSTDTAGFGGGHPAMLPRYA
jgi:hypothetical protein